jgi:molybdate transport system ATP-binding protein
VTVGLDVRVRLTAPLSLDVDVSLGAGESLAIVGPSGAGKTSLLRTISGGIRPEGGQIVSGDEVWFADSANIWLPAYRRRIGLLSQSYALFPHMTALQNVIAATPPGNSDTRRRSALELLERVGLGGLENRRPGQLSGGQQQRTALARAIARSPRVMLLDEPFSAVDHPTRHALIEEVIALRESRRIPVILVTHELSEACRFADRILLLAEGRAVACASPEDMLTRPPNATAARLLDMRNIYPLVSLRTSANGEALAACDGWSLAVSQPPRDALFRPAFIVIPEGRIRLLPKGRPDHASNVLPSRIVSVRAEGQAVRVTVAPRAWAQTRIDAVISRSDWAQLGDAGEEALCLIDAEAALALPA